VCDRIGGSSKRGFYVELGANNGFTQSNTLHLEVEHGWSGILIEPVPVEFGHLVSNRGRRNQCVNAAAVGFDFGSRMMRIAEHGLMSTPLDGISDIADRERHASSTAVSGSQAEALRTIEVRATPLDEILASENAPLEIDFLSLDVEGGEMEVLRGIDFSRTTIRWILVESRDIQKIQEFLEPFGYVSEGQVGIHDYLLRFVGD